MEQASPLCVLGVAKRLGTPPWAEFFDAEWYAERYEDVSASGLTPIQHFLRRGAGELREPNPPSTPIGTSALSGRCLCRADADRAFRPLWRCGGQAAVPRIRCLSSVHSDRARLQFGSISPLFDATATTWHTPDGLGRGCRRERSAA